MGLFDKFKKKPQEAAPTLATPASVHPTKEHPPALTVNATWVLRDKLKDTEHFQKNIEYWQGMIFSFEDALNKGFAEHGPNFPNAQRIYMALSQNYIRLITALYSCGAPLGDIGEVYAKYKTAFLNSWDYELEYVYNSVLNMLSLGVFFGITEEENAKLAQLVVDSKLNDCLIDFLMKSVNSSWQHKSDNFKWKNPFEHLRVAIETDNEADIQYCLTEYLTKYWYKGNKSSAWYGSHKRNDFLYSGYWSYEAGAIARAKGIDDNSLESAPYYPCDLVHY